MNRILFEYGEEDKYKLELGDMLYLNNRRFVVCLTQNRKIGLMDIDNFLFCDVEFDNLKHLTSHMINKKVDDNTIRVAANYQWTVYFP